MKRIKPIPKEEETLFDNEDFLVSKTDLRGIIIYVNKIFREVCKYKESEMVGAPHNLIRHPDMPKACFYDLWQTIQKGKEWRGLIKNLCSDGSYYWVDAYVVPNKDENGKTIGFTSMRRKPKKEDVLKIIPIYREQLREEQLKKERLMKG